jgi:hypothetical protein
MAAELHRDEEAEAGGDIRRSAFHAAHVAYAHLGHAKVLEAAREFEAYLMGTKQPDGALARALNAVVPPGVGRAIKDPWHFNPNSGEISGGTPTPPTLQPVITSNGCQGLKCTACDRLVYPDDPAEVRDGVQEHAARIEQMGDLIAWTYRRLREATGMITGELNGKWYPTTTLDFSSAAERLVPDVKERAHRVPNYADMIGREEPAA